MSLRTKLSYVNVWMAFPVFLRTMIPALPFKKYMYCFRYKFENGVKLEPIEEVTIEVRKQTYS